jgi:hypothetical protein
MNKRLFFFIYYCQLIFITFLGVNENLLAQEIKTVNITQQQISSNTYSLPAEKCGQTILESQLEKEMGFFGSKPFFESWVDQKIEESRNQPQILSRINQEPRLIPVVVHVIHSGQAIGVGSNIPVSQIEAQIRILNEDYRRQNQDAILTPSQFLPVAADANIEFVLAKQDPQGLPTNGIVRIQGRRSDYAPSDATLIGQLSQWDPNEYLNIWVTSLTMPYIGYASFPISDLPGLSFSPSSATVDGVTIDYRYFGVGGSAATNFQGRTATHEIGHYLGLRHIWGDGGCGIDDFVADTPLQDASNNFCTRNTTKESCGNLNMIQNYMDYTPDACMNLFTKGQVERFNVVLANSPRRASLVNNRATRSPQLEARDLAISRVLEPGIFSCSGTVTPSIEVTNAGTTVLTSGKILLLRNGVLIENSKFTFRISSGQSLKLNFKTVTLIPGENEFEFRVIESNDLPDQNSTNNTKKAITSIQEEIQLPYSFDIANNSESWSIKNPDDFITWNKTELTISGKQESLFYMRHYEYNAPGQQDFLISPSIDLSRYPNSQMVFEMAHARFGLSGFQDELMVAISKDCGDTFDFVNATYKKFGELLETTDESLAEFIPSDQGQFRLELLNLKQYANLGKVKIAFISKAGYGNNLYLKNIQILPQELYQYDLKIDEIISPNPIVDGTQTIEQVKITNSGNLPISRFYLTRSTSGMESETSISKKTIIDPGESLILQSAHSTSSGKNRLDYKVFWPNGDQNKGNEGSSIRHYVIENDFEITAPWRQKFDTGEILLPWLSINPQLDKGGWQVASSELGSQPDFLAKLQNQTSGNTYWLGSPLFDLTLRTQASVFFDVAAGEVSPTTTLKLMVSENAGETYAEVWKIQGKDLTTLPAGQVSPKTQKDFNRIYVNLSSIAGKGKNRSRIAFVVEGGKESDQPIFLDNIELFQNADPDPVIPTTGNVIVYPNPANELFNVAFNLPSFETVTIQIVSSAGNIVQESRFPQTLNQTYSFSTSLFNKGLFILRITSNSVLETKKLIIQ